METEDAAGQRGEGRGGGEESSGGRARLHLTTHTPDMWADGGRKKKKRTEKNNNEKGLVCSGSGGVGNGVLGSSSWLHCAGCAGPARPRLAQPGAAWSHPLQDQDQDRYGTRADIAQRA